jgi:hypothetical protein
MMWLVLHVLYLMLRWNFYKYVETLLMEVILQFALCFHELQSIMVNVDDYLLLENVILPLAIGLYNGVHFFVISGVLTDDI